MAGGGRIVDRRLDPRPFPRESFEEFRALAGQDDVLVLAAGQDLGDDGRAEPRRQQDLDAPHGRRIPLLLLAVSARHAYDAVRETMAALGGANSCLDTDPGRAAAYETALMDLFATCVHGAAHAFALASAESIAPGDLAPFAVGISAVLSEMIPRWAERLRTGRFPGGRSTVASAAATLTRLVQAASAHGLDTGALAAAKRTADRAVAAGHGRDGLARLVAATAATAGVPAPPSRG